MSRYVSFHEVCSDLIDGGWDKEVRDADGNGLDGGRPWKMDLGREQAMGMEWKVATIGRNVGWGREVEEDSGAELDGGHWSG